jgi:IclR family KDG regulon transcriptional repressor
MADKTLSKGLFILELLAEAGQPLSLSEISDKAKLTRSNVHRLLHTLKLLGYVIQTSKGAGYEASLKIWEVGSQIIARIEVTQIARCHLRVLAGQTNETVHLSVINEADVIYIDKIDSLQPVRAYSHVGGRATAYRVATGKVLLAALPENVLKEILTKEDNLKPKDQDKVISDLAITRELGCAYNFGEWRESINGIAAPIKDRFGEVIAAIGISGPAERLGKRKLKQFRPMVIASAQNISKALGFTQIE